jgi:hypothetical protein
LVLPFLMVCRLARVARPEAFVSQWAIHHAISGRAT